MLDTIVQDLRFGMQQLRRRPGFAATALAIIALGIGASTAAFTLLNHVLLRPLPFPDADRLVLLMETKRGEAPPVATSAPNFLDWRSRTHSFAAAGAYTALSVNLIAGAQPRHVDGAVATSGFFAALNVAPEAGRPLTPADDPETAPDVVVLGDGLARGLYGSPEAAIGQTVKLNDQPHAVVGVMPPGFLYPSRSVALWTNLHVASQDYADRTNLFIGVIARLAPGVGREAAQADLERVASQLEREYPAQNRGVGASVVALRDSVAPASRAMVMAVFGAAACLLLIACTNLANLLFAQSMARQPEIAVRLALGAPRSRLVRQLITECLALTATGGMMGLAIATAFTPLLSALVPDSLPIARVPHADWRVFAFACVLIVATALGAGIAPALRLSSAATPGMPRTGGASRRQHSLLQRGLVLAEVAGTVVLLVMTGLLLTALWQVQHVDPGFRADGVLTLRTPLPMPRYAMAGPRQQFYSRVLTNVRALPGVRSAAYTGFLPLVFGGGIFYAAPPGTPQGAPGAIPTGIRFITSGYFDTLRIPLLRGRDVSDRDTFNAPFVVVISRSLAERLWPGRDPLGRMVNVAFFDRKVVGVVEEIHVRGLERGNEPQVYMPFDQVPNRWLTFHMPKDLAVRADGDGDALSLAPTVRRIIHEADPELPVTDVRLLRDIVASQTAPRRLQVVLLGAFAGIAFLLAAVGIHGLVSFFAVRRRREVGIRLTLGATPREIGAIFLKQALVLGVAGVGVALPLAYLEARSVRALLFGVTVSDPLIYGAAAVVAVTMTVGGSLSPAIRASRVDPVSVLRAE